MKRTPLRRTAMKRARARRRAERSDDDYTEWIHRQRCYVPECGSRHVEQHHKREGAGMGMKSHDRDSIPLCTAHHGELHALCGYFRNWDREGIRVFMREAIEELQSRYSKERGDV